MASNVITSEPRMLPDSWQRARAEWQVTGKLHPLPAPGQVHTGRLGKEAQGGPRGALLRREGQPPRRREGGWASLGQRGSAAPPFTPSLSAPSGAPSLGGIQAMQSVPVLEQQPNLKSTFKGVGGFKGLLSNHQKALVPLQPLCTWEGHTGAHYHTIFNKSGLCCFPRETFPGPLRSYLFIGAGRKAELATEQKAHFSTAWSLF